MRLLFIISIFLFAACSNNQGKKNSTLVDLTYTLDSTTLFWPNNSSGFEHILDFKGKTEKGYFYSSYKICTPEHGGTHLDAPIHFAEGKQSVEQIPLSNLCGEAIVIDVSKNALANRDYLISIEDINAWEKTNGELPKDIIILFRTGYGKFYPNRKEYFGTELKGDTAIPFLHFLAIDPKTAQWLVDNRSIKAVGIDVASIDYGQSTEFKTHQIFLEKNIPAFENLAQLDKLPLKGIYVTALPMKIGGGSGAPLRIIAEIVE
jgi:kynurenine formamidase